MSGPQRNDPCPCGSGRKYKKCCMGQSSTAVAAPVKPSAGNLLRQALACHDAGRHEQAARLFQAVLEQRPRDATALAGLGQVYGAQGRLEEAIELHRRAIASDGARGELHLSLADLLFKARRPEESIEAARRATRLSPREASAHTFLAYVLDHLNRLEEAEGAIHDALVAAPRDANASLVAAGLERRRGKLDEARARLEEILARADLDPALREWAQSDLGFVLDAQGDADDAFAAFARAGALQRASPLARSIDAGQWTRRIEAYRRGVSAERLAAWRAKAPAASPPVRPAFLVGFPRSGTTMTEQVLAAHPAVVGSDEVELMEAVRARMRQLAIDGEDVPSALDAIDPAGIDALRAAYFEAAERAVPDLAAAEVFLDKLPLHIVDLPLIEVLFPDAKIIVALRDPRDVCLSCFMQKFSLNAAMVRFLTLEGTADFYAEVMGWWLEVRPLLALPVLEVHYRDTVTDLERQARRLLEHLELPWDDRVLRFHEQRRFLSTPSAAAVTEKVHTRALARWRRYEKHFAPVTERLAPYVEAFGDP